MGKPGKCVTFRARRRDLLDNRSELKVSSSSSSLSENLMEGFKESTIFPKLTNQCQNWEVNDDLATSNIKSIQSNQNTVNNRKMNSNIIQSHDKKLKKSQYDILLDQYHQATASKLYDVEELIDFYFHRRLAAVIAVIVSYLPFIITPNQITIFGLLIGWISALCAYDAHFHSLFGFDEGFAWFLASITMFSWIVSDCADGQVARLCKRGTRTGRILDGVVDGLVIAPNLYVVGLVIADAYEESYFNLAVAAGLSLWVHAIVYDKIKNIYMEHVLPESECAGETVESVQTEYIQAAKTYPFSLDCVLLGIYYHYLHIQAMFTTITKETSNSVSTVKLSKEALESRRTAYANEHYHIARLSSFIGISAHVTGLYVAYGLAHFCKNALVILQLYYLVFLNAICIIILILHSRSGMAHPEHSKARIS